MCRYDRTAAIGLLDSKPQTFGSVPMTIEAISEAGACGAVERTPHTHTPHTHTHTHTHTHAHTPTHTPARDETQPR